MVGSSMITNLTFCVEHEQLRSFGVLHLTDLILFRERKQWERPIYSDAFSLLFHLILIRDF